MKEGHIEYQYGAHTVKIECGKLAKQANAAVTVSCGGTTVLVAVTMSKKAREGIDFFPLMVEYVEKTYSAGRIPGGFFKREARPSQKEILTARIIDRPIRPLFPEGFLNDVIVSCIVVSSDGEIDPDVLAIIGASSALSVSDIPYDGPVGAVRVSMVDGEFISNPSYEQQDQAALDLLVVGVEDGIVMIEGEAKEVPEDKVAEALEFAFNELQASRKAQIEFRDQAGKEKIVPNLFNPHPDLRSKVSDAALAKLGEVYSIAEKGEREDARSALLDEIIENKSQFDACLQEGEEEVPTNHIVTLFDEVEYDVVRDKIFNENKRADGRAPDEIRELASEVNILARTHGSALFTRGQTQALGVVTLGTKRDEQMVEGLKGLHYENFYLHYNFPPFSVGEARPSRAPGRREIGHGALAAKGLKAVLPTKDDFPYTIRLVSEILESNGSSSMASVCAGCLALMAAGVPIKNPIAGISIGLVSDGDKYALLSDIMGLEDHFGDMDYKIAGSTEGITAIQLDIKTKGLSPKILKEGITHAREARLKILENMTACIATPSDNLSPFAPRIVMVQIPQEKIGEVIGPGGKMIKKIIEETGAESIDIDDDGKVHISALSEEASSAGLAFVKGLVQEPEIGKTYDVKVMKVANFGAFVEFLPGKQGLIHVSELADEYVKDVTTVVEVGDQFRAKLLEVDKMKRVNLSKKQAEQLN